MLAGVRESLARTNAWINDSKVGRFFEMPQRQTCFTTELRAGLVTFLTMAYILAVNAQILTDSGGPCTADDCSPNQGDPSCKFDPTNTGYTNCLARTQRSLITATAAASCIGTFFMGVAGNMPLGIAPGMGLNAYFAYNVVGFHGSGNVPYKVALAAIFVEGWIFILLAVTGARGKLIQMVPRSIMLATSAGIGLFLAFIGLQSSEGIGLVTYDSATLVTLGGCPFENRANMYTLTEDAATQVCNATAAAAVGATVPNLGTMSSPRPAVLKGRMESAQLWLGLSGFILIALCMRQRVRGAMLVGILWVTFISWIPGSAVSFLGSGSALVGGEDRFSYFKKVVAAPNASFTAGKLDFGGLKHGSAWLALITFLYVDFLDATGTLFSMAGFVDQYVPGFIRSNKTWPRSPWAFSADGTAIVVSSLLGSSPCTVFVESASGIREGGRTGVAAITTSLLFFIALFFTPIFASIPPWAIGPALITVGAMMVGNIVKIRWDLVSEAVPAFVTIAVMPLTYSIAYGFIGGICTYILLNGIGWGLDFLTKKGVPLVGPSEILLDKEDLAGRNVYAKNASVGGRVAQPTEYDSNTKNVVPVGKDIEDGPSTSSSEADAAVPVGDEPLRRRSNPKVNY